MLIDDPNRPAKNFKVPKYIWHITFTILATTIFHLFAFGQITYNNFSKLSSGSLTSNDPYHYLGSVFDSKITNSIQIVGMGEVSHGGYEPIAFKAQMIRYLVERKGYRKVLFEQSDIVFIRAMRVYLNNPNANDPSCIAKWVKYSGFTAATSSVYLELFKWIKQFNDEHPKDLVEVIGFEIGNEQKAINFILNKYVIPYDYKEGQKYVYRLNSANTDADKIELLNYWFKSHESALKAKLSIEDFQWLSFYMNNAVNGVNDVKSAEDINRKNTVKLFRDSVLFENVRLLSSKEKTIIWAHNGHVVRAEIKFMGNLLHDYLKSKYYVIVTDFSIAATVEVVAKDSTGKNKIKYITNVFKPVPSSASYKLLENYGISEGIFFPEDLIKMKIREDTNIIDANGLQLYVPAFHNSLDALVVFPNIHPIKTEKSN